MATFQTSKGSHFLTHNKTNRYKNFLEATAKKFEVAKWKNFYTAESVTLLSQFRVRLSQRIRMYDKILWGVKQRPSREV